MSTDLVSWLRSALDEHERLARAATGPGYLYDTEGISDTTMAHIERNDPAHVLRTVAAHRAILDAYEDQVRRKEENSQRFVRLMNAPAHVKDDEGLTGVKTHGWELSGRVDALRHSVQQLASIYEERPGFDPSWRAE